MRALLVAMFVRGAAFGASAQTSSLPPTWTADNGNGTYSNPLFYDEFSDPDLIRVGGDFYLTGTTMHAMPGLPVLHSRDLVNWEFLSYALDRLDLGPEFRLEDGKSVYGQGIWAPSFRYHNGAYYIFANVNRHTTQLFRATNPRGPWSRTAMKRSLHDLSVLFDDDGKTFVVWGYQDIHLAQLDESLTDIIPGTERVIIEKAGGMGEGSHFYKIQGKYYIVSAWWSGRMRMPCARADRPEGPYEVNPAISADEDFGLTQGYRLRSDSTRPFTLAPPDPAARGHLSLHQGGVVDTPAGEWWGFSMMDYNSVGRVTSLSPVTWKDGWPYFGLSGNLGRTPRIWVKPKLPASAQPSAPYQRNETFDSPSFGNVWQWNHVPDDTRWSLVERKGFLRLHSLPASDFWSARNSLTQRAIGPQSTATTILESAGMRAGDVAGLALLNYPYAWIGVRRDSGGVALERFDQSTGQRDHIALSSRRVWLRVDCDFITERAHFSYSTDGTRFTSIGAEFTMVFQLKTFQGVRYSLFHYNAGGVPGGYVDFDAMTVHEPHPRGLTRAIPFGKTVTLDARATPFVVVDRGLGRVALRAGDAFASVAADSTRRMTLRVGAPTDAETFQWIETPDGELTLLSLASHRYLRLNAADGSASADATGPTTDHADGIHLHWAVTKATSPRTP